MRVGPPRAHEDGLDVGKFAQVCLERGAHGIVVPRQLEVVGARRGVDELLDVRKGIPAGNVDCLESIGI